jgi:hypothetical protein
MSTVTTQTHIHPCPVADCTRTRKSAQDMCALHRSTVPPHLTLAELEAWDATIRDGRSQSTWLAYLAARSAVLDTLPGYDRSACFEVDREALAEVDASTSVSV